MKTLNYSSATLLNFSSKLLQFTSVQFTVPYLNPYDSILRLYVWFLMSVYRSVTIFALILSSTLLAVSKRLCQRGICFFPHFIVQMRQTKNDTLPTLTSTKMLQRGHGITFDFGSKDISKIYSILKSEKAVGFNT